MPLIKAYLSLFSINTPPLIACSHLSIFLSSQPFATPLPVTKPVQRGQFNFAVDADAFSISGDYNCVGYL